MPRRLGPRQLREQERRVEQAEVMRQAATQYRDHPDETAGVRGDADLADAVASLIETIADGARENVPALQWRSACVAAKAIVNPPAPPKHVGPLPSGYSNPRLDAYRAEHPR